MSKGLYMGFLDLLGGTAARVFKLYTDFSFKNPSKLQRSLLREILKKHSTTLFGKKHGFGGIKSVRQFQKQCQPQSYNYFKPYIDAYFAGTPDALFNSHLLYFAQTAGTTGAPKLIPITYNTLTNYTLGVLRTACYYISENFSQNSKIIGGKWLYLPAPPILRYISGIPVGYITGLLMLPYGAQLWRYPLNFKCYAPLHLMHIKNIEEKFRQIALESASKNITVLVGVTPVMINLLENILKYTRVQKISDLFPNLEFAIFSGVPPKYYESRLNSLIGKPIAYREMYAASEGMLAVQLSERPHFTPLYDSVFFEFVSLKDPSERLLLHEAQKGHEYRLIITSHNGLYAYDIGDILKIVSEDPITFTFSFRKGVIDLADEKLTPTQVFSTIETSNTQNRCSIIDFCVVGTYKPKPHYTFLIEFESQTKPNSFKNYLQTLDRILGSLNDIYFQNREGSNKGTLAPPELWILKEHSFSALERQKILEGRPAGQIKTIHLTKDTQLVKFFEDYVQEKVFL